MTPRELALAGIDGLTKAAGHAIGGVLALALAIAGFCAAWDLGTRVAPRVFEARRPLIQVGH